jgi:hypothetical protein
MDLVAITYTVYATITIILTIWVGNTLFKRGRIFIVEAFHGKTEAADSVNHLLLVGFYLINFGFVSLFLSVGRRPMTFLDSFEYIATKIGIVLVVLGAMHFFNMKNIAGMRSRALKNGKDPLAAVAD